MCERVDAGIDDRGTYLFWGFYLALLQRRTPGVVRVMGSS